MDQAQTVNKRFVGLSNTTVIGNIYANQELIDQLVSEAIQSFLECGNRENKSLLDVIKPSSKILIKPNYVHHSNLLVYHDKMNIPFANECFITQPAVIKSLIKLLSYTNPRQIIIGDAPIQHCNFDDIVSEEYKREITKIANCDFIDFRRTIFSQGKINGIKVNNELGSLTDYLDFDLKGDSLLEEIIKYYKNFRVTDYPPQKMLEFHQPQKHIYRIHRAAIDADYIFTLPKLKTHIKAGITGALKSFIGVIGNKECLPHHRLGFPAIGGDCYKENSLSKLLIEVIKDKANSFLHNDISHYEKWNYIVYKLLDLHIRFGGDKEISGSWSGNDTLWRTILDINRIITYGCSDGTMSDVPQRIVFSLVDAVISGQGQGPMRPEPLPLGIITFADSQTASDLVSCALLGFDPKKIPHVNGSTLDFRWPLASINDEIVVRNKGQSINLSGVYKLFGENAIPPLKWEGLCDRRTRYENSTEQFTINGK
jgi:uncharacterized protein (DUF362 family)